MHVEAIQPAPVNPNPVSNPRPVSLTPREEQIAQAIAAGRSNRDIAAQLGITEQTVKNHLTNIFGKVGVENRLQLALALVGGTVRRI